MSFVVLTIQPSSSSTFTFTVIGQSGKVGAGAELLFSCHGNKRFNHVERKREHFAHSIPPCQQRWIETDQQIDELTDGKSSL